MVLMSKIIIFKLYKTKKHLKNNFNKHNFNKNKIINKKKGRNSLSCKSRRIHIR